MKTEKKLKIEKTKRKKTLHYEGESTKNSVVCGAAGVEFALELCVGSSDAVWNALAKRLKVNCGVCRLFCFSWNAYCALKGTPPESSKNLENL